ncbi:MAG: hypothetical protein CSYNP_02850 [Syntrophus sp. SKADARSKE-3]|nr:hypothetical protein [Syntrophus sp. SKADARSKE-3]
MRQQAEDISMKKAYLLLENGVIPSAEEVNRLFHELHVHQIELEMQNEELCRAQVELEEIRARYFDLYDLAPVGYIIVNEDGLIVEANLTAATLFGVARSALTKVPLSRFIFKEDQDIYYQRFKNIVKSSESQTFELRMERTDGTLFWAAFEATAMKDSDSILFCRVVLSDISERKRLEEEHRKIEDRLKLALTSSNMGVWEWDIETGTVFWSPELFEIMGVNHFNKTFNGFIDALHPEDVARVKLALKKAVAEKEVFTEEYRVISPRRGVRWLYNLGRASYDIKGKPLRMTGTVQDITDRKQIEETLQRYKLMSKHSRDIMLFINSDIGHI